MATIPETDWVGRGGGSSESAAGAEQRMPHWHRAGTLVGEGAAGTLVKRLGFGSTLGKGEQSVPWHPFDMDAG